MLRFVALALVASSAIACSRRNGFSAGNSGSVTIGNPNWPASLPPTPQPTPPPPPPPLPTGWLTPPHATAATAVQQQSRKNCKRRVELQNVGTGDNVDIEEIWVYDCTFQVCLQTDVAESDKPQNCGCSLSYARNNEDDESMFEAAYATKITRADIVSYDVIRSEIVEFFTGFRGFELSENLTSLLESSAATANMDYSNAMAAFVSEADPITAENMPKSLDYSNPENSNNIPAFCFEVAEEYQTQYRWPQPPIPLLSQQPNIWQTNCIPWTHHFAAQFDVTATKRQEGGEAPTPETYPTTVWWREFMTFPTTDTLAVTGGFNPGARLFRSFYRDSLCSTETAFATFDNDFRYQLTHESQFDMYGAYAFFRQYKSVAAVGGAPRRFQAGAAMTALGYVTVEWQQTYSFEKGAYRQGVFAHALLGTEEELTDDVPNGTPFIGATKDTQLCQSVPEAWKTCANGDCDLVKPSNVYGENAFFYVLTGADDSVTLEHAELDCAPAYRACTEETTFLSAINSGLYGRDFTVRPDSLLAVGTRFLEQCPNYPSAPVFDSVTFSALQSGAEISKRGSAQIAGAEKRSLPSHIKYAKRQDGAVDTTTIVAPTSAEGDPALGRPEVRDVIVQAGGGSADANGMPTGDHPVRLFAETYAVPVSMDPEDIENDVTHGRLLSGPPAPCIEGTKGCTCRTRRGRPRCDAPLECSAGNDFPADVNAAPAAGYCRLPACLAGEAGCECSGDDGCGSAALECVDATCVFKLLCTPGSNGCTCDEQGACAAGICTSDNKCVAFDCPEGLPGCECRTNSIDDSKYCFAEQGALLPVTVEAVEDHTGAADELSFTAGDEIIVEAGPAGADDRSNLADPARWNGKLGGNGIAKFFPTSKVRVAASQAVGIINAFECTADSVCKDSTAAAGELGGSCQNDASCSAGQLCTGGICQLPRCEAGSSGCSCMDDSSCKVAGDVCMPNNICMTPTCAPGEGGCTCSLGRCGAGFQCEFDGADDTEGRCVKERCEPGSRGCPCKQSGDSLSCDDDNFKCGALKADGSDLRCIAQGKECSSQTARCVEFCGEGNVQDCPPCSDQVPICKPAVPQDSSAGSVVASFAALVALLAVALF